MEYRFKIEDSKPQLALSIRTTTTVGLIFQDLDSAIARITDYLKDLGIEPAGPPFAAYYNWDIQKIDIEIGFPLNNEVVDKGDIQLSEIPGGKRASTFYKGPYRKIAPAYKALTEYIEKYGHRPGVNYEFYYNSNKEVPESELLTKIVYLLK